MLTKSDTDEDTAVLQAVRNWIEKNLEKRGLPANSQGVTNKLRAQTLTFLILPPCKIIY